MKAMEKAKTFPNLFLSFISDSNGKHIPITHVGYSHLPSSCSTKSLKLHTVLCFPHIKKSLISISKLTNENDVFVEFHSDACYVKDKATGTLLLEGQLKDGLYSLSPKPTTFTHDSHSSSLYVQTNTCNCH